MKSDLILALRNKWVQCVLLSSLGLRIFFFILLPKEPSILGPDEVTYAFLSRYVADGLPVQEFPDFGPGLYNSTRSLILPSSALVQLGLNELISVRLVSSIYGLLSSLFLILCLMTILHSKKNRVDVDFFHYKLIVPVIVFTFMPSNFLWSILGLRESSSQFWIIATFYFLLKLYFEQGKSSLIFFFLSSLSLVFAFGARKETALVLASCALVMSFYILLNKRNPSIFGAVALGLLGGQLFVATPAVKAVDVFFLAPSIESKSPAPTQSLESKSPAPLLNAPSGACQNNLQVVREQGNEYVCQKKTTYKMEAANPLEITRSQVLSIKELSSIRAARAVDAKSALPQSGCIDGDSDLRSLLICNLKDFPLLFSSFLFRPFPLIDSGPPLYTISSLENIVWLIVFLFLVCLSLLKKIDNVEKFILISLFVYIFSFSALASLYQGNLGTAFRHKSSILWPLMTAISILLFSKKRGHQIKMTFPGLKV